MKHEVNAATGADAGGRVGDGAFNELDVFAETVEILTLAGREVVEDNDVVPSSDEMLDEMRSDEARAAGDEIPHMHSG